MYRNKVTILQKLRYIYVAMAFKAFDVFMIGANATVARIVSD